MLDNSQLDILVENLQWYLINKRVDDPLVILHRDINNEELSVRVTFALYGKMYQQEVSLAPRILNRLQTYEALYTYVYRYIVEAISMYMKTIDRTETWELVPKT